MVGPFGFEPKKTMRARAFRFARELVGRGHQVCMIMPPWHTPEQAGRRWVEDGVLIVYTAVNGGAPAIVRRLIREVEQFKPDVAHCFKPKAYSGLVAEWFWRTRKSIRVVMDTDDWEGWGGWNDLEPYPRPVKTVFAVQEKWGMQHCHALTVASRALETLAWGHGVAAERVFYLPNSTGLTISANHEPLTPQQNTLLLYTRFFEFDVARLATVIGHVQEAVPHLQVRLVGASLMAEDADRFRQLMEAQQLWDCVEDVGWIEEDQLPSVLGSAETALYLMDDNLLNRTKCPVKLADLCALGIPVVAEGVGQIPEYVLHNQTGFVHTSGDVEAVAQSVIELMKNRPKRTAFSQSAITHMAQFHPSTLVDRLERAYTLKS